MRDGNTVIYPPTTGEWRRQLKEEEYDNNIIILYRIEYDNKEGETWG